MAHLENVKTLLSIKDTAQDELLNKIIDNTEKRLLTFLPADETQVPARLNFIIEEVAVKRYNRIGAEGMTSETLDGHSTKFNDDDFAEFLSFIERLYPQNGGSYSKGKVTFY
ncbi:phage head-tail connector protein [Staphylococcus arlettae]|uniref:phage head-tail connector protein n=1 Tax=Staphylococcus arlettae TaxID=29378 RepID=UPI0021CEA2EF|nr:phage head-tail connector protein [Staphylococcus arlettae]UXU53208.1 phage head-tail connector protein [Staphylococcus arlettae]